MPADLAPLPSVPPELIAMLRDAEMRYADLSADFRRFREALEGRDPATAGAVAERLHGAVWGTVSAVLPSLSASTTGAVTDDPQTSVSAGEGDSTGVAPSATAWMGRVVKEYGPTGVRIVDILVRLFTAGG